MTRFRTLALAMAAVLAFACGEQPDPGFLLTKARVIGTSLSVQGDAERTTPRPGESLDVEWLLTAPDALEASTSVFIVCEAGPSAFGVDFCVGDPIQFVANTTPSTDPPSFTVEVPEDTEVESLLVLGSICIGGQVQTDIDPDDPDSRAAACVDEGVGQIVTVSLPLLRQDEDANRRPRIAGITFDGEPWTAELDPGSDRGACADLGWPEARFGSDTVHTIGVDATEGSRETYVREIEGLDPQAVLEDLQNSLFSSEEGLQRQFAFIDDINPRVELDYTALELENAPPPEGRAVRFEFVMRDLRGGIDRQSRALCLLP